MRKLITTVAASCLTVALSAAPAAAHGHKAAPAPTVTDTLTVNPDPPAQGQLFADEGTGFSASTDYSVHTLWPTGNESQVGVTTDANGAFALNEYAYFGGTYTIDVYATVAGGDQGALVASVSFAV